MLRANFGPLRAADRPRLQAFGFQKELVMSVCLAGPRLASLQYIDCLHGYASIVAGAGSARRKMISQRNSAVCLLPLAHGLGL